MHAIFREYSQYFCTRNQEVSSTPAFHFRDEHKNAKFHLHQRLRKLQGFLKVMIKKTLLRNAGITKNENINCLCDMTNRPSLKTLDKPFNL